MRARMVAIQWRDGRICEVDLAPAFANLKIFRRVREDDALFQTMSVDEYGDALVWDDGAELSAMWIAELAEASMSNTEFRAAMDDLRHTLDSMALRLGVARRLIAEYRKDKPIPKHIALATRHLLGLRWDKQ